MPSIVIAAHNEAAIIGMCLDSLLSATSPGEFDVTVVANGCTDETAEFAAARAGVRVIDLPVPGKVGALNAGDDVAVGYPRIYLDADIFLSAADIRKLCGVLESSNVRPKGQLLAATARRAIDVSRSSVLVRAYYAINSQLPVYRHALFGRGIVVLSAEGRNRFDRFPDIVADDMFLDSLYDASEKMEVEAVCARVLAPRRTRDLVRRLVRVRRGNMTLRASLPAKTEFHGAERRRARISSLMDVALPNPRLVPSVICYLSITVIAAILARRPGRKAGMWERDDSSRQLGGSRNESVRCSTKVRWGIHA